MTSIIHDIITGPGSGHWAKGHWFFLVPPHDFPEQLLRGNEMYYMRRKFAKQGEGKISDETMKEYLRCSTPEQIPGVCSDYRATLAVDFPMDTARLGFIRRYADDSAKRLARLEATDGAWWARAVAFFDTTHSRAWIMVRRIAHTARHRAEQTTPSSSPNRNTLRCVVCWKRS